MHINQHAQTISVSTGSNYDEGKKQDMKTLMHGGGGRGRDMTADWNNQMDPSMCTEMSIVKGLGKIGDSIYTN